MRILALAAAAAALAAGPAMAQIGNPAGMKPGTPASEPGLPAPGHTNTQDELFVRLLGMGNRAEIDAARLAGSKARSKAVKDLAQALEQDHSKAGSDLAKVASRGGLAMPEDVAPEHRAERQRLDSLAGDAFDRAYLQTQLVEHQKTVQLLEWEIGMGQDPGLVRFAVATLPTVMAHLESVQRLWADTTGAAPSGLAGMPAAGTGRVAAAR